MLLTHYKIHAPILMFSFLSLFSGCQKNRKISNKHITFFIPKDFKSNPFDENDILYIEKDVNGLTCVLSIDNAPDLLNQPNATTVKESTPKETLINRFYSIEDDTKNLHGFNWKNFKIVEPTKEARFKGYPSAEGTFTVDEAINGTTRIIQRKIKRMVVFKDKELWNIVLAPSQVLNYDNEMKDLNSIIDNLQVK